jgi:hypothetical protein
LHCNKFVKEPSKQLAVALGLAAAAAGGVIGYFAFFWIARQGFYALVLPPSLVGLAAGLAARRRSVPLAVICAAGGLGLGLFTEWRFAPFTADRGFGYFITHVQALQPVTLVMLALGTVLAFRFALRFDKR